jgi:hypothetical protein
LAALVNSNAAPAPVSPATSTVRYSAPIGGDAPQRSGGLGNAKFEIKIVSTTRGRRSARRRRGVEINLK